jgi:hypothetical protein
VSPFEIAHAVRLRLAAELDGDRASLGRLAVSIEALRAANERADPDMRTLALAFQLERFYTAVESVLRTLDGDAPQGAEWHTELLRAASVGIDGLRPPVVPPELLPPLRELLGFRHFARHAYDTTPELRRVDELAGLAMHAHALLEPSLAALAAFLRRGPPAP